MHIKTKTFQVTPKELRGLIAIDYYKRMRIFLIISIIFVLLIIVFSILQNRFDWWLVYFLALIAYLVSAPLFFSFKGRTNALTFQNRFCEMDENFFTVYFEDGSLTKLRYEHFNKVVKKADFYFLYITNVQFHYLPVAAFEAEKDIHRFDLFLEGKQLIKLW